MKPPEREPVRVAQLLHTMAYGGVETAILNWNRRFDRSRVDARLLCFANPGDTEGPFVSAAAAHDFTVTKIPWSRRKPVWKAARLLAAHLRQNRIEVLHCHNTYANIVGLLAAKMARVKTVTTMYVWGDFGFRRNLLQHLDAFLMKRFDRVSAHCESCFRDTVARGIDAKDLALLICGYPASPVTLTPEERAAWRSAMGARPENFVLLYMARFWPEKAHDNLLQSFRILLQSHPQCRLWLPGVGPELEKTRALCGELGLNAQVDFLGFRKDADAMLAAADLQVHPSDNEGVALAVCAGMSAGLPIVATRVGGLPEVLRHDVNSILVKPREPVLLAQAIAQLIDDRPRAEALGREAKRFILEEYSLELAVKRVEDVYLSLVNRAVPAS